MPVTGPGLALQQGVARTMGVRPRIGPGQPEAMVQVLARPREALERLVTGSAPYTVEGCLQFHSKVHGFAGPMGQPLVRPLVGAFDPNLAEGYDSIQIGSYFRRLRTLLRDGAGTAAGLPLREEIGAPETVVVDRGVAVSLLWRCALVTEVLQGPERIVPVQRAASAAPDVHMRRVAEPGADLRALSWDPDFVLRTEDWLPLMMTVYQDNGAVLDLITAGVAGALVRILWWLAFEDRTDHRPPNISADDVSDIRTAALQHNVRPVIGADPRIFIPGLHDLLGRGQFRDYPEHTALVNGLASWCLMMSAGVATTVGREVAGSEAAPDHRVEITAPSLPATRRVPIVVPEGGSPRAAALELDDPKPGANQVEEPGDDRASRQTADRGKMLELD